MPYNFRPISKKQISYPNKICIFDTEETAACYTFYSFKTSYNFGAHFAIGGTYHFKIVQIRCLQNLVFVQAKKVLNSRTICFKIFCSIKNILLLRVVSFKFIIPRIWSINLYLKLILKQYLFCFKQAVLKS